MASIEYAYSQFCAERFPLPMDAQLADLEQRIGVAFPDDYRRYVLEFNGGYFDEPQIAHATEECPRIALTFMCGIGASHEESELGSPFNLSIFDDNDPPLIFPIGGTALGGLIILATEGDGRGVILYKEPYGTFFYLADGINEFFGLLQTPSWRPRTGQSADS
jgi:hypothetical protein